MRHFLGFLAIILAGACSGPEQFVAAPKIEAGERVATGFASIEVADISLPAYAARDEIGARTGDLLGLSETLWPDDPTRAMTLALTRHLAELTGARVASEPWPFDSFAEAKVEVRVEELRIEATDLRMLGQYFVVDQDGRRRDHAHLFDLSVPLADQTAASIAAARAQAVLSLATEIAQDGL